MKLSVLIKEIIDVLTMQSYYEQECQQSIFRCGSSSMDRKVVEERQPWVQKWRGKVGEDPTLVLEAHTTIKHRLSEKYYKKTVKTKYLNKIQHSK